MGIPNGPVSRKEELWHSIFGTIVDFSDVSTHNNVVRVSNKSRYALRALFDIAYHQMGDAAQIKDIAARQGIPARFLEQIFQDLKRAGLVRAKRGPRGGYRLAKAESQIRLGDIMRALEGPVSIGAGSESCKGTDDTGLRVTEAALEGLSLDLQQCFDAISVADLCERASALGAHRLGARGHVYSI